MSPVQAQQEILSLQKYRALSKSLIGRLETSNKMLFEDYSVLESQNKLLLENNCRLDLAHKKQMEKRRSYKKAYKDQ
jgi:hypothetical protein